MIILVELVQLINSVLPHYVFDFSIIEFITSIDI